MNYLSGYKTIKDDSGIVVNSMRIIIRLQCVRISCFFCFLVDIRNRSASLRETWLEYHRPTFGSVLLRGACVTHKMAAQNIFYVFSPF